MVIWRFTVSGGSSLVTKSSLTLATPWTVACQAPLSLEFSRQEYWSGLPFPSPGDLPNPSQTQVSCIRQILYQTSYEESLTVSTYICKKVLKEMSRKFTVPPAQSSISFSKFNWRKLWSILAITFSETAVVFPTILVYFCKDSLIFWVAIKEWSWYFNFNKYLLNIVHWGMYMYIGGCTWPLFSQGVWSPLDW